MKACRRIAAIILVTAAFCALTSGCMSDNIARNVYEGVKNRNEALTSAPPDYSAPRAPDYDDYERERRALAN